MSSVRYIENRKRRFIYCRSRAVCFSSPARERPGEKLLLISLSLSLRLEKEENKTRWTIFRFSDLSDVPENLPLPAPGSESPPQALNYSQIASAAVAVSQSAQDPSVSSTETLLRNIQGLLKVAADNARQQERQINYEKGQWQGPLS